MRKFIDLTEQYISEMQLLEKTSPSEAASVLKRHGATDEILADPVKLKAFRAKFMKANHPDKGGNLADVQEVNDAFDIIGKTGYVGDKYGSEGDRRRSRAKEYKRQQEETAAKARQRREEEAAAKARDAEKKAQARKSKQDENKSSNYSHAAQEALSAFHSKVGLEQPEKESDDLYHLMTGLMDAYGFEVVRHHFKEAMIDYNIDHTGDW